MAVVRAIATAVAAEKTVTTPVVRALLAAVLIAVEPGLMATVMVVVTAVAAQAKVEVAGVGKAVVAEAARLAAKLLGQAATAAVLVAPRPVAVATGAMLATGVPMQSERWAAYDELRNSGSFHIQASQRRRQRRLLGSPFDSILVRRNKSTRRPCCTRSSMRNLHAKSMEEVEELMAIMYY